MTRYAKPFRLSVGGSTRATAYQMGNKIVTLDGKTHVVWLDAVSLVRGRTYDHASQSWGETLELFEGCDNHCHPTLTADAEGHLHLVYGPHGFWGGWNYGRFKHVVADAPNSLENWAEEGGFGYNATYASMVSTPAAYDAAVYRGGEAPSSVMFQRQRPEGGWTTARELMGQDVTPQYTHVGANIVADSRGTLYVGGHFYNMTTDARSGGAAILKSADAGDSWTDLRGESAALPIRYTPRFAIPGDVRPEADVRLTGLALAPDETLWALAACASGGDTGSAVLSKWTGDAWETIDLAQFMPPDRLPGGGPLLIDARGRIHIAAALRAREARGQGWGHPSHEVFHLESSDGGASFACNQVSETDETTANWLPSLSLAGPFHPVEEPVIMYTRGDKGDGCSPETTTEVYVVFVADE